jgi:hypothetical protein
MPRRARLPVAALLAAAAGSPPPAIAQDAYPDTSWIDQSKLRAGEVVLQTGRIERGEVTIDVATLIRAPKETIWNILAECEIAPEYVPNVVACELIDSINDGRSELFIQTVKPAFFMPRFEHVFRLDYFPYDRIDVHRVSGPIAEMEGSWWLLDQADGSVMLLHTLRLQPGIPVPRVFVRATLRRDLPIVLDAVRGRAEGRRN